jgi:hypothetical protein
VPGCDAISTRAAGLLSQGIPGRMLGDTAGALAMPDGLGMHVPGSCAERELDVRLSRAPAPAREAPIPADRLKSAGPFQVLLRFRILAIDTEAPGVLAGHADSIWIIAPLGN